MINKLFAAITLSITLASTSAFAADASIAERLRSLEDEIKILKKQSEVKKEGAAPKTQSAAKVEIGQKGLQVSSQDGYYNLSLRALAQLDGRLGFNDGPDNIRDQFLVRRARPIIEAKAGDASLRFMPDFGNGNVRIFDFYADYHFADPVNVRVGKFKSPIGLERLKNDSDLSFIERGLPTNLAPDRDIGVEVFGNIVPSLEYQIAVVNGATDLGNEDSDNDDSKDIVARLFAQPFKQSGPALFKGFGFGIAGSTGQHDGSARTPEAPSYATASQTKFFAYRAGAAATTTAIAGGSEWRIAPQAYYYLGSLGILGEYIDSSSEIALGSSSARINNRAWQVEASYVLTGEDASFTGVKPARKFEWGKGGWGAFEAVARYGQLKIDDSAFPIYANPATAAHQANEWLAGANWYLNDTVKVAIDYANTAFKGGAAAGADRDPEQILLTRVQYKF